MDSPEDESGGGEASEASGPGRGALLCRLENLLAVHEGILRGSRLAVGLLFVVPPAHGSRTGSESAANGTNGRGRGSSEPLGGRTTRGQGTYGRRTEWSRPLSGNRFLHCRRGGCCIRSASATGRANGPPQGGNGPAGCGRVVLWPSVQPIRTSS